ncbi:uncharacterized protein B0H18DRAFT_938989 [Fomitopsis serialis]|uniref:uncharacterized protein n=1 Tax=Fomitopsis serialis TaxID=139415 RepID=UPI00200847FE|nr:uncharacterized protein B0H18DRAFT_938989 [Neoantrodia serialis]KAH9916790.1 hypothetical protein B0H18DRAFT_938989 [Neoantrodia serialis]
MASSPQTTPAPTRTASESSWAASRGPVPPHAHAHGRCPVTGAESHDYCPPQADDSRSPCPALNTLANHGYLPRDGKCITPAVLVHALRAGYHLSLPLAWFLTHGGFYLLGQRRKRICLRDLSRHNCIEHNASLVHPDVAYRDEYAPVDVHLHMLEDLLRYSTDGKLMTPDDVARVRVVREAEYAIPMDKVHAEIARGEMAIPPAPPPPAALPGVPNHMLRVWMHEERLPDGWTPYHRVGLLHTIRMATRLRRSMRALQTEQRRAGRTRTKTIDGAVAALVPALTIATPDAETRVVVETGDVGGDPLTDDRAPVVDSPTALDTPRSTMTRNSTLASSDGLRTPLDVPLPAPALGGGVKETVREEEGIFDRIRERVRAVEVAE